MRVMRVFKFQLNLQSGDVRTHNSPAPGINLLFHDFVSGFLIIIVALILYVTVSFPNYFIV